MTSHVQTIEENAKFLTPKEIAQANVAKQLLHALGYPSVVSQPQDHHKNKCNMGQPGY